MRISHGGMGGILLARRAPLLLTPAYANTGLTALSGALYAGLNIISRELVGYIPSVRRDTSVERAAVGQAVTFPIVPEQVSQDIVPSMTIPTPPDNAFGNGTMAITKAKSVPFGVTGEEARLANNGVGWQELQADLFAEGLRTLVNEVESDLAIEASTNGSRAWGTAGTTPFSDTNRPLEDASFVRKILDDNGAPQTGRSLVLNTTSGAKLRGVPNLTRVNEAGDRMTLRDGELLNIHGFSIKESGQQVDFVAGTAAGATTNAAGYAVGARTITLASAGTGTVKAGDFVTFAGDTNKYGVAIGDADTSNGGTITLHAPGLRRAIPAAATAITVVGNHALNVAFSRDAMGLAMRAPALPPGGDAAVDRMMLTDPRSGASFEVSMYAGYKMMRYEVGAAWGVKAIKPRHIAVLLG